MDPNTVLTTAQMRPLLRNLEGQLPGAIKTGIERLLPLFRDGKARYADALNALCPDHDLADPDDRKDAFKQFQNLVARFGKVAAATGLALRSDSFKRNEPLEKELRLSKRFRFEVWDDRKIPVGARWDAEIKQALAECHFGLLFLTREFLLSEHITREELPVFVSGKKPLIPVGLTVTRGSTPGERRAVRRSDFAHELTPPTMMAVCRHDADANPTSRRNARPREKGL